MKKVLLLIVAALMAVGMEMRAEDVDVIKVTIDGVRYAAFYSQWYGNVAYVIHTEDDLTKPSGYTGDIVVPATITHEGVEYNVRYVDEFAFYESTVTSVDLPASIATFYEHCFMDCMNLQRMVIRAEEPPKSRIWTQPYTFLAIFGDLDPDQLHVFVPAGCIEVYQESDHWWNEVRHYHEIGDPEGVENVPVSGKAHKKIVDGVMLIEQDGKVFNVLGTMMNK